VCVCVCHVGPGCSVPGVTLSPGIEPPACGKGENEKSPPQGLDAEGG
jgi:hypothetical protein